MGCYGIGVGRLAAAICEEHHDDNGPIWPARVAPWQAHICCLRADTPNVRETADKLYRELQKLGVETIYDDRAVSAGIMFADADLLGIPFRVIVSPRGLDEGLCEIAFRDKREKREAMKVPFENAAETIKLLVSEALM
jgi:prolyl-tRNA synthetase